MISTKNERMERGRGLLTTLLGFYSLRDLLGYKRPPTLPAGMNYSGHEWRLIREAHAAYRRGRDISIQLLFELDEIAEKYKNHLFLAKLEQ